MLILDKVNTGYGAGQVLFDLSLRVEPGECVSLMGRNGMGKTTTIRTIMGQLSVQSGHIHRFGNPDQNMESFEIARAGIGLVPEGRLIFPNLSVAENLKTFFRSAQTGSKYEWTVERVLDLFPRLQERLEHNGNHLSGG